MKMLTPKVMKWLKFFHILFSIVWIGSAIGMNLLKYCCNPQGADQMYMLAYNIWTLDQLLIWVGVMGCLVTGIIYGVWTKWGFFKQRWLTLKWILVTIMVVLGTFVMGPAVNGNVNPIEWYTENQAIYDQNMVITSLWGGIQLVFLAILLYLSVFKPHKNK